MNKTLTTKSSWSRFAFKVSVLLQNTWVKYFVVPVITSIPGAYAFLIVRGVSPDHNLPTEILESAKFVGQHAYISAAVLVVYVAFINFVIAYFERAGKGHDGVDVKGLLALFGVLEQVVGAKADRFGAYAKSLNQNMDIGAANAFKTITRPDQQIALIVTALHAFIDAIDDDDVDFRVTVVVIENGVPSDWLFWVPQSKPPRTTIEQLQSEHSAISYCLKKRNLIVIEDIQKEGAKTKNRRFVARDSERDEEGSLICYPVLHTHTNTIPYVITVICNRKGYFQMKKKDLYLWVLKHFGLRISLEHSLLIVKQKTEGLDHD